MTVYRTNLDDALAIVRANDVLWESLLLGKLAECAVANLLDLPWSPRETGKPWDLTLGPWTIDVKTTYPGNAGRRARFRERPGADVYVFTSCVDLEKGFLAGRGVPSLATFFVAGWTTDETLATSSFVVLPQDTAFGAPTHELHDPDRDLNPSLDDLRTKIWSLRAGLEPR